MASPSKSCCWSMWREAGSLFEHPRTLRSSPDRNGHLPSMTRPDAGFPGRLAVVSEKELADRRSRSDDNRLQTGWPSDFVPPKVKIF